MRYAQLTLELKKESSPTPTLRWQRDGDGPEAPFELLGRAFEVALRESELDFGASLRAFCHGALIRKADVLGAVGEME